MKGFSSLRLGLRGRLLVVARRIFLVHHDIDIVFVFKIEEELLLVADHHGNILDARFFELFDLALDQYFIAHRKEALRLLVRDRSEAA